MTLSDTDSNSHLTLHRHNKLITNQQMNSDLETKTPDPRAMEALLSELWPHSGHKLLDSAHL